MPSADKKYNYILLPKVTYQELLKGFCGQKKMKVFISPFIFLFLAIRIKYTYPVKLFSLTSINSHNHLFESKMHLAFHPPSVRIHTEWIPYSGQIKRMKTSVQLDLQSSLSWPFPFTELR